MNANDFLPKDTDPPRQPEPLFPACKCLDEAEFKKWAALERIPNIAATREAITALVLERQHQINVTATETADTIFKISDTLMLCDDAKRHFLGYIILNLAAKMHDIRGNPEVDFSSLESVRNRTYQVTVNIDDLFSLVKDLALRVYTSLSSKLEKKG